MSNEANPFGDQNPFADPSIQRVTQNVQITQQSLDDYNPFAQNNTQIKPAAIIPTNNASTTASSSPQTYQPTKVTSNASPIQQEQPPQYKQSSSQQLNLSQMEKQQQELDRRAAELDRREHMINAPATGAEHNFPPLPTWCPSPFKPCFYQDIGREIPIEFQKWVRFLFYLWLFHSFTLGFNVIAALVIFICGFSGETFGLSIVYFIIFTPMSYACWFRPAYKGFRSDSSMNFMLYFFIFFCQIIINILEAIGFSNSGFCGFLYAISISGSEKVTGMSKYVAICFVWVMTVLVILKAAFNIFVLIMIHRLYRNTGASFEKAQKEFATGMMSNKNVQNAAATVVTESARVAMQQTASSYGSPGKF